jgi:hypothetical protein
MRKLKLCVVALWTLTMGLQTLYAQPGAGGWPSDSDWKPLRDSNGDPYDDPISDATGSKNLVGDASTASAYIYNSGVGNYQFFRLLLEDDPRNNNGGYEAFGYGVILDTDGVTNTYELLIILDGIDGTEPLLLKQNDTQTTIDDPSDDAETEYKSYASASYTRVVAATSTFGLAANKISGGATNYYLDLAIPYEDMLNANNAPNDTPGDNRLDAALTTSSPIRAFFGTSSSARVLSEKGADLIGSSEYKLSTHFSQPINLDGSSTSSNSAPVLANAESSALTFTEGDAATVITSALTVADSDDTNIESATVQITGNLCWRSRIKTASRAASRLRRV